MGIVVKKDDSIVLLVNGITALTIRANVNIRPLRWWDRLVRKMRKEDFGGSDPFNLTADVVSTTDRSQTSVTVPITVDGEVDSALVGVILGTISPGPGEIYAQLFVQRSGNGTAFVNLCEGYVHGGNAPTYPSIGLPAGPFDGPGRLRSVVTADPAAGTEVLQAMPTGAKWRPLTLTVQLVQGITQTPLPALRIRSSGSVVAAQVPITGTAIGASTTAQLTWGHDLPSTAFIAVVGDEMYSNGMPDIYMTGTDDIGTITDGIGANTNYGAANITVEEWIDP